MSVFKYIRHAAVGLGISFLTLGFGTNGFCVDPAGEGYFLSSKFLETTESLRNGILRPVVLREEIPEYAKALTVFKTVHEDDRDFSEAFKLFKTSAEKGHPDAQHRVGMLYEQGRGTEKDLAKALTWYQKAYKKGLLKSGFEGIRLSWMILGDGDILPLKVEKYFRELVSMESVLTDRDPGQIKSSEVQYRLGILKGEGWGLKANPAESILHFEAAMKDGDIGFIEDFSLIVPLVSSGIKTQFHGVLKRCVETAYAAAQKTNQGSAIRWLESREGLWKERGFTLVPTLPTPVHGPVVNALAIPEEAIGYEEVYRRFLGGKLIYTDPTSKAKTELPIRALSNPLEGTFDLSGCGDTGQYLSISTGYRKAQKPENASKVEIWLAPWFLVNKNLSSTAKHLQPIMGNWDAAAAPVGLLWTWGGWSDLGWFDYLTTHSMDGVGSEDLWEKWKKSRA